MKNTLKNLLVAAFCLATSLVAAAPVRTQSLTILGGSGVQGAYDAYTEYFNPTTGTWTSAVLTGGSHPWGLLTGTNSWLSYQADMTSEQGCTQAAPCKYLYRVRFSAPATWTTPLMTLQLKVDNVGDVRFNNTPVALITSEGTANADLVFSSALQPGINTLTFEISDWGGLNGFNYRIDLSVVSDTAMTLVPATPPPSNDPPPPDPNTKSLSIFGATGVIGQNDLYTEYFDPTLGIWQQAFLAGVHPWGLLSGTSSWLNYRPDLNSDVGCSELTPCKYLYRVRFSAPTTWTNPKMSLLMKVDNSVIVRLNGTQVAAVEGNGISPVNADVQFSTALTAGTNTLTFELSDYNGLVGFNYRIDLSVVSTAGSLGLISGSPPPPPPPPPVIDPNTKYLSILGGTGTIGGDDGFAEWYNPYTGEWQPAKLAGIHSWGLLTGTTSWLNFQPTLTSEDGCTQDYPCVYLYRVRFTAPSTWTNPKMTLQMKVDNTASVSLNNTPVTDVVGQGNPTNADLVFSSALLPGTNTLTFQVGDWGSFAGFNYRIDLSVVSTSGSLGLVPNYVPPPPPPPPPPPKPVSAEDCKKDGWKLLGTAEGAKFKNQGDCVSYFEHMKRVPVREDQCKDYRWMVITRANGTTFKNQGDCMQYVNTGK